MEYPLIGLIGLAVLVALWNAWSGLQVDMSVASLNATIAGQAAPEAVLVAGQWLTKALVGAVIGGAVTALAAAGITWIRKQIKSGARERRVNGWKGGPNAQWERGPRAPSEAELMRMALMRELAGSRGFDTGGRTPPYSTSARPPALLQGGEDEPEITF
jgi:hypothetical protein